MAEPTGTRRPDTGPEGLRAALADAWRSALGLADIAEDTDFFHEGGDSVLAVEIALLVRELTGTEVDLDILYDHPRFGALLAALAPGQDAGRARERELTGPEERLWAVEQLHPGTAVYHVGVGYRFPVAWDVARLRTALRALAGRHEALRRGFVRPGRAVTVPEAEVPCRWVDARGVSEAEVAALVADEVRTPFDLARPPLLRALVVDRGEEGGRLVLTAHHLVCDGLSLALLEADVERLYADPAAPPATDAAAGAAQGTAPAPRPARAHTPDATAGPGAGPGAGANPGADAALAHWRAALADCPPGLALPHDRPRPARLGTGGAAHRVSLAPGEPAALWALAREERLSPFMAWTAAYVAGLAAVTGERDVVVCVPLSSRTPEQAAEVGMFVDILPLRVTLAPGATPRDLLRHVRRVVTGALAHPVPFQTLVDALWSADDRSRAPLAQTALTYLDTAGRGLRLAGHHAEREQFATGTAKYELLWSVTRRAEETVCELEFSTDLCGTERGAEIHRRLLRTVRDAFARPDDPLPLAGAAGTAPAGARAPGAEPVAAAPAGARPREARPDAGIHQRVRRQAAARPDAVAVRHAGHELTYRELDRRAAAVATGLRRAGHARGAVVAVPMERGIPAVVACLGVLYAGCAYLPVDAGQPAARAREILRAAADAALVPAQSALAEPLSGVVPTYRLADLEAAPGAPGEPVAVSGEDVAYVMSTSGSTGRPKAVLVPHRAVSRLVPDADFAALTPADRVAHVANPAFDAATFEMWGALTGGGTLVIADRDVLLSPARLRAFLAAERITVMFLTVTLLNQLVDFAPDAFASLRVLVFGGEKQDNRRLRRLFSAGPAGRVVNGYGPTENTTFSTAHTVTPDDLADDVVPLGAPLPRSTAHVLDEAGRPVPPGGTGELYVGGDGLAHGYLGAPELTAASFVPDPFGGGGGRLYRTGDQVRVLPDGRREYVGRLDGQVKVRGHRVEPGEIEHAARRLAGVADAVVLARPGPEGTELTACVTPGAGAALDAAELRERLREELPPYLVPAVRVVERVPVTPNGKADHAALRDLLDRPDPARDDGPGPAQDGRDPLAAAVAAVWREVLGTDRAAPGDDFLRLGGHSLKALRLLARLDEELAAEVELADFFAEPTLAALTGLVRADLDPKDAR
ncbi:MULTISPECIES: non-ribosomal peptide synthetase [Streptomyces]|uniref:non-ribosomal peptide synthetase n=1 Tax=Streptomyces TaxID=1883 RepID=UPI002248DF6B|nr:amino acid adenylation domain-containing protein [Streptomyces sp. JHD 1]MCX2968940.1 amino acid adenylation domain-containing protein [Streptomyces sp. JHD 1]